MHWCCTTCIKKECVDHTSNRMEPLLSMSKALNRKCAYMVASENINTGGQEGTGGVSRRLLKQKCAAVELYLLVGRTASKYS